MLAKLDWKEVFELAVSAIVIGIILAYPNFHLLQIFLLASFTAFVLHELGHKLLAKKFGCFARFRWWPVGLFGGLVISVGLTTLGLPFKVAAPGAVLILPYRFALRRFSVEQMGMVAAAGPAINIMLASVFFLLPFPFASYIAMLNAWLAFFNLLPFPPLDGAKIFSWKPWLWFLMLCLALLLWWL